MVNIEPSLAAVFTFNCMLKAGKPIKSIKKLIVALKLIPMYIWIIG